MKTFLKTVGCLVAMMLGAQALAQNSIRDDGYLGVDSHRLPSAQGLTGLFLMNTALTLNAGEARVSGTLLYEDLNGADETIIIPATFTLGLSNNFEISAMLPTIEVNIGTTSDAGTGDGTVLVKWKFHTQNDNLPTLAIMAGAQLPTASEVIFEEVEDFAAIAGILMSVELPWFGTLLGIHAEAQGIAIDPRSDVSPYEDDYQQTAFGLNAPLSDNNRLNLIIETLTYSNINVAAKNGSRTTFGLRYMFKYINFGAAVSKFESDVAASGNDERFLLVTFGLGF